MTVRRQQVASTLKRLISDALQRQVSDPRIAGLVSVTRVELSSDMAQASVFVSVMPAQYERRTLAGLRSGAGHIARLVRPHLHMRRSPRLEFRLDDTLKKQAEVYDAIREGIEQEGPAPAIEPDEPAHGDAPPHEAHGDEAAASSAEPPTPPPAEAPPQPPVRPQEDSN